MPCQGCETELSARERMQAKTYNIADQRREKCKVCEANQDGQCLELGLPVIELTKQWHTSCPRGQFAAVRQSCPCCGRAEQILSRSSLCQWCEIDRENKRQNEARRYRIKIPARRSGATHNYPIVAPSRLEPLIKWAAVVTTAPRRDCTLRQCIDSMAACGWTPTIFAEPKSTTVRSYETFTNKSRLGVWHNWLQASRWAIEQRAEYIITVQDDSLFHPQSREFIESIQWPADAGFVSLYTPKHYSLDNRKQLRPPGVRRVYTSSLWGACALVWRPETLAAVINHPIAKAWCRRRPDPATVANSDTAIGRICNAIGLGMWFCDPSPVSHIARFSTIGHGGNSGRRNAYRIADHSLPLSYQVLGTDKASETKESRQKTASKWIGWLSVYRRETDRGVGDVVERVAASFGGRRIKKMLAALGVNCGCTDRQKWLNETYPFE